MRKTRLLITFSLIALALLLGLLISTQVQSVTAQGGQLRTTLLPLICRNCGIEVPPPVRAYWLVHMNGPIQEDAKQALLRVGAEIMGYMQDFTYIVRMDDATRDQVEKLPAVHTVFPYTARYKLTPDLATLQLQQPGIAQTQALTVTVALFPDESPRGVVNLIDQSGGKVIDVSRSRSGGLVRASISVADLAPIADIREVAWIASFEPPVLGNDVARQVMDVNPVWQNHGLFGQGQVVAVADTGLDTGDTATLSADFAGRLIAAFALGRTAPPDWSDPNGHGTHVAGSVLGNGSLSGSNPATHNYTTSRAGVAPEAQLVFQSILDSGGSLGGIPADYNTLFQQAYNAGARIHTNSWGGPGNNPSAPASSYGLYDTNTYQIDQFLWEHKDMTILFLAHNNGSDSDSNGVVDQTRLDRQGAAKNAITVGATESNRPGIGNTWGGSLFPVGPINGDFQANNPAGMAAFSSRGPTQDSRIKPDVVAPGTWIVSTRSHVAPVSPNDIGADYTQKSGTSMATPLTAGTVALIREYYQSQRGLVSPSSALIKATLINGAVDLNPGQYGGGATQEMGAAPNVVEGWGRVNLTNSIFPADGSQVRFDDEQVGLLTGGSKTYTFVVNDTTIPFRVTMAYTDHPGWPSDSGAQLRNDLDMLVIAPDGTPIFPNGLALADRRNNVERVVINTPQLGVYTVQVSAFNVPFGPQPYALVATGALGPRLELVKHLVTPASGPAKVGDMVTFDITITNASGSIITSLPLEDRFEDAYLEFDSATPAPDNVLGNTIRWNDLTAPAPHGFGGDLGLNNSVRIRLNFRAKGCPPNQTTADVASVTGAIAADDLPVPTTSVTSTVDIACAKVSITKTLTSPAGGTIWTGVTGQDQATFNITIQNTGNKPITTLPLSDTYNPDHLQFVSALPAPTSTSPGNLSWANLASSSPLLPGESVTVVVTLKAVGCPSDQLAPNTAKVQGAVAEHSGLTFAVPDVTASVTVTIPCPYVSVKKTLVTPVGGIARLGDAVTFNIEVKATGNKPIVFVQLEDEFNFANLQYVSANPAPNSVVDNSILWNDLTSAAPHGFGQQLLPGQSFNVTVTFTAKGCPPQQTSVNRARITRITAMHEGQQLQVMSPAADAASVDIACPELQISKTLISPTQNDVRPKETARFQITIQNTGNKAVTTLPLIDTYDAAYLDFVTASIPPDSVAPGALTWNNLAATPLLPGQSLTLTVDFRAKGCPPDQLTPNTATIRGAKATHGSNIFDVPEVSSTYQLRIPCPDMVLKKTVLSPASGVIGRGETVTFRIQITATGNKQLVRIPLVDTFDHRYLAFVSATLPPDSLLEGQLVWDDLTGAKNGNGFGAPLLPGQTYTVDVTFRQNGCPPGQVTRNTARADDVIARHDGRDYQVVSDSDSASIKIACPEATVIKTRVTQQPPECPKAGLGDRVTFNVLVRNTGNTTLVNIPLVDVYEPDYLRFDSAVPQPNSSVPLIGSLTWNDLTGPMPFGFDRDLKPGESFTVTLNFTALKSTQNRVPPVTTDTATVQGATDEFGYTAPTSTSSASVEIADADLFVQKSMLSTGLPNLTGNQIVAGELITYEITYGNNGPDDVDHARLVDIIPPGTVFVKDTLCGHANTGCFLGHIQAGFSSTFLLTVRVPLGTLPGTALINTVQIESGQTVTGPICDVKDANPANNHATATSIVVADFGDAVEPPYRTRLASGGPYHGDFTKEWLGAGADGEVDAKVPDNFDDGVLFRSRARPGATPWYRLGQPMEMFVTITTSGQKAARYGLEPDRKLYLRAWVDWNRDGVFNPATDQVIEWAGGPGLLDTDGQLWPIDQSSFTLRFAPGAVTDTGDYTWIRFRLSYGSPPDPSGQADYGEVEDYRIGVFIRDP